MASNLLARLTVAGAIERTGGRTGTRLRVAPRFLAHAEATVARLQGRGQRSTPAVALAAALTTWDEFHGDCRQAADFLLEFMEAHDQMGALRPVFPALERFAPVLVPA